jgi:hypothetical protein
VADNPSQGGLPVSREKAHRETGATVNIRDFDQGAKNQRLHDSKWGWRWPWGGSPFVDGLSHPLFEFAFHFICSFKLWPWKVLYILRSFRTELVLAVLSSWPMRNCRQHCSSETWLLDSYRHGGQKWNRQRCWGPFQVLPKAGFWCGCP